MRSAAFLSPIALLASGCAAWQETYTPAVLSPSLDWESRPTLRSMELPSRSEALRRWMLPPSNAWAPYAKYTLLTALNEGPVLGALPDVEQLDVVYRARIAAARLAASSLPADTLWIVDLRGAGAVAFGATLSQSAAGSVSLVPTFNNWPAAGEIVPAEETLSALATMAPLPVSDPQAAAHPVFLLDSWRLAYRFDETDDETYDNRYSLSSSDFPDAETLRARGIRSVVYVVENMSETTREEDDLHRTFLAWDGAGIKIAMLDLAMLSSPMGDWDTLLARQNLVVEPRVTIFTGPSFFVRARGGFGGAEARPSEVAEAHGGGWGGGGTIFGAWGAGG